MKTKLSLLLLTISFFYSCSDDDDNSNSDCFSPTQNLINAYDEGFVGCDCDSENDIDICVQDSNGRNVALICSENKWAAVEDGPCSEGPSSN